MANLSCHWGGIGRFLPCRIGADHCRSRHIGWEKCGHGLTSRPRETSSAAFRNELLLLRYPPGSAPALLSGILPLKYFAARFASKVPAWRLPLRGSVANLVTDGGEEVGIVRAWWRLKRVRLN